MPIQGMLKFNGGVRSVCYYENLGTRKTDATSSTKCKSAILHSFQWNHVGFLSNYNARLCNNDQSLNSPDPINPHNHVTTGTPHAAIFDAGLAAHKTRLLGHVRSTTVFMKTPCYRKKIVTQSAGEEQKKSTWGLFEAWITLSTNWACSVSILRTDFRNLVPRVSPLWITL